MRVTQCQPVELHDGMSLDTHWRLLEASQIPREPYYLVVRIVRRTLRDTDALNALK